MVIDAATLPNGSTLQGDFCIIGGGIVALTLARELAATGAEIIILESGGLTATRAAQELYRAKGTLRAPAGDPRDLSEYMFRSRARYFGGSGNVWGGKCGVLEPVDFEGRPWVRNSGWPFGRAELDPCYQRACRHLDIPDLTQPVSSLVDASRPLLPLGDGALTTQARFHTAFTGSRGDRYAEWKDAVTRPANIRVYLNANVTSLQLAANGRQVTGLTVRCLDGRAHTATARRYLLATGGLENVRLLLQSHDVQRSGIGNDRGLVGSCFSGHVNYSLNEGPITAVAFTRRTGSFALYDDPDPTKVWGIVGTTQSAQQAHRLPNFWGTFSPLEGDADAQARAASGAWRTLEGVAASGTDLRPIRFMVELESHVDSRVSLGEARDALGQRQLQLDWRLTPADVDGLRRSIQVFASALGSQRLGRLRWPVQDHQLVQVASPARHHMGTTRMHGDPAHGVVDANCRVHGVENLYIGGSSIFPTGGVANPTLTIMALTLRLADHLRPVLRS